MCNNCDCEGYERCSIREFKPHGYCCPMCMNYDAEHSCDFYETMTLSSFSKDLHILPRTLSSTSSTYKKTKDIILYP